jgi:hypothetical protein
MEGDNRNTSLYSESGGLAAVMTALAGFDFVIRETGVDALRIVDRLGGFKL